MQHLVRCSILILFLAGSASAGEWHVAGSLQCEDCHLQHSSDRQDQASGGPYSYLLKKVSVNELCLSCHDGSNSTAPDVFAPAQMYQTSLTQESSAGAFSSLSTVNHLGHSLGVPVNIPLRNSGKSMELNCASCHAVHGNGNYRNLEMDPAGTGATFRVTDGTDLFTGLKPDNPPTAVGSAAAYTSENVGYVTDNMSAWCTSCHDMMQNNTQSSPPAHFNGHPSNVALNSSVVDAHTDPEHWVAGIGEGFIGSLDGRERVPFLAPLASTFIAARTVTAGNEVACVSCHKAHGSVNKSGMLWPYLQLENGSISGCQQCHNK